MLLDNFYMVGSQGNLNSGLLCDVYPEMATRGGEMDNLYDKWITHFISTQHSEKL